MHIFYIILSDPQSRENYSCGREAYQIYKHFTLRRAQIHSQNSEIVSNNYFINGLSRIIHFKNFQILIPGETRVREEKHTKSTGI